MGISPAIFINFKLKQSMIVQNPIYDKRYIYESCCSSWWDKSELKACRWCLIIKAEKKFIADLLGGNGKPQSNIWGNQKERFNIRWLKSYFRVKEQFKCTHIKNRQETWEKNQGKRRTEDAQDPNLICSAFYVGYLGTYPLCID